MFCPTAPRPRKGFHQNYNRSTVKAQNLEDSISPPLRGIALILDYFNPIFEIIPMLCGKILYSPPKFCIFHHSLQYNM